MAVDQRQALLAIKRFDQLIAYLRDELGWPISKDSFDDVDDLFYDFSAEELGIDPKTAAKIQEIKRLRPLSAKQPWGIFFVKFEPKKLPIVVLRRILGQVAFKKRTSANSSERTAWSADDLLFISNYGEGEERQISFAHFSQSSTSSDLPTLRVLGWNNLDTPLHLDSVATELNQNLKWPEDDADLDLWRKSWSNAFKLGHNEVINTAKDLSINLAVLASNIRDRIRTALAVESETGPLTMLMKAFQTSLVHDLNPDGFADMYAQTISYGLLSARITDPSKKTVDDFTSHMRTSPFLKELMETFLHIGGRKGKAGGPGIDFDELGVGDVIQLLDKANMEAVIRDFGYRNRQEDPVMHFFEGFLHAYNKKIRKERGVFYTPQPVVSYIVRSVHELLKKEFNLEDGLASTITWGEMLQKHTEIELPLLTNDFNEKRTISPDEFFVQILDPATGTATFLVEVIDVIYKTLNEKWSAIGFTESKRIEAWNEYVPKYLLSRIHAYELMMAPYAIAHMKISLKLAETGYRFRDDVRARVYLTNALEPWRDQLKLPELDALAHEAAEVNEIKRHKRFTVVIGNPPYAGESSNPSDDKDGKPTFIGALMKEYFFVDGRPLGERNSKWLQDDYAKFIRFGEYAVEQSGTGILGYITNHSFVFNATFRGMRQHMLSVFNRLDITNLHGSNKLREKCPDGSPDENVFDIEQGVAISLGVKRSGLSSVLTYGDLWGIREKKYATLGDSKSLSLATHEHVPVAPFYLFFPQSSSLRDEFMSGVSLTDIFPLNNTGIITKRDALTIHDSAESIWKTVTEFASCPKSEAHARFNLPEDVRDWTVDRAQNDLNSTGLSRDKVCRVCYRPFDIRFTYFTGNARGFVGWPVEKVSKHMLSGKNLAMCVGRAGQVIDQGEWNILFCTRHMTEFNLFRRGGNVVFPLYLENDNFSVQQSFDDDLLRKSNLSPTFLNKLSKLIGIEPDPLDIFYYAYAIFQSTSYRTRYDDFLKIDFPRLPLTMNLKLFTSLVNLGNELISMHLLESPKLNQFITKLVGFENLTTVDKITWLNKTVWVDKFQTIGFEGVSEDVWNFSIGGYRVCEKWLKDRKGKILSNDDLEHYQKIIFALSETLRISQDIDLVIDEYGGWPDAFKT